MLNFITSLFNHYGYAFLFAALMLELIAFPLPGETLMTYCGFLVFQGKLSWLISVLVAATGVIIGITTSYFIGRLLGREFFIKYGSYIHMGPDKLDKISKWLEKYGNGLLVIVYFIPGVRHVTGYFSGISKITYKQFAINAYIGAFLWTGTFISLGKVLGANWENFHGSVKKYLVIGSILLGVILVCIYLYKSYRNTIIQSVKNILIYSYKLFHSLGKVKIAVTGTAIIFIILVFLAAGLIQDFFANEFDQFDKVTSYIISQIFPENWAPLFSIISLSTAYPVLIFISILLFIWITVTNKNRGLEIRFMLFTILSGEFLEEFLRYIFHRRSPFSADITNYINYTFPSEQSLMALIIYGFAAFIIVRHIDCKWIKSIIVLFTFLICILTGISPLFFNLQYPSDVAAGYVFGGAWLSMNIILLEVFRIMPGIERYDEI